MLRAVLLLLFFGVAMYGRAAREADFLRWQLEPRVYLTEKPAWGRDCFSMALRPGSFSVSTRRLSISRKLSSAEFDWLYSVALAETLAGQCTGKRRNQRGRVCSHVRLSGEEIERFSDQTLMSFPETMRVVRILIGEQAMDRVYPVPWRQGLPLGRKQSPYPDRIRRLDDDKREGPLVGPQNMLDPGAPRVKLTVSGYVGRPSAYVLPEGATVVDALEAAGGIVWAGALHSVVVCRRVGEYYEVIHPFRSRFATDWYLPMIDGDVVRVNDLCQL